MTTIETSTLGYMKSTISLDLRLIENGKRKPIVIFCHGFKGFKDWGAWNLVAEEFAKNNLIFLKFNFSHNGTTTGNLLDFENLEAFSENNYTKELEDLESIIKYINSDQFPISKKELDLNNINLIGHSRGGGAVLVKSFENDKISRTATWASIDSYDRFGSEEQIEKWKTDGQHIFVNGRTGQKMPIKYQFHQDYIDNKSRLNIENAVSKNNKDLLIVHGSQDPAVAYTSAENIKSWSKNAALLRIENANHVFGANHPYTEIQLPKDLAVVVKETISFLKK